MYSTYSEYIWKETRESVRFERVFFGGRVDFRKSSLFRS
jgi:hypothetical protein